DDPKKTEHLLALDGAKERLKLIKADLLEEGSFDAVVDGCDGVFHTASPFSLAICDDPQANFIDPALKGTMNVLGSCAKTPSVKRVVLTSSVVAVLANGKPRTPQVFVDVTWWSDPEFCKQAKQWYFLSKTLAEDAAWKFVKNASAETYPNYTFEWVNVKDVANARILLFENPLASGRYCIVESVAHCSDIMNILRELYPTHWLPEK
ncbi:cinnamoyl-coa reductase 1, partial [Phtheirospermum japonicum]